MIHCLLGSSPHILVADFIQAADADVHDIVFARLHPMVSSLGHHDWSSSVIVHFRSRALTCGTVFPTNSLHYSINSVSGVSLRRFSFARHILTSATGRFIHNRCNSITINMYSSHSIYSSRCDRYINFILACRRAQHRRPSRHTFHTFHTFQTFHTFHTIQTSPYHKHQLSI